jgi:hypothetical protein
VIALCVGGCGTAAYAGTAGLRVRVARPLWGLACSTDSWGVISMRKSIPSTFDKDIYGQVAMVPGRPEHGHWDWPFRKGCFAFFINFARYQP